MSNGQKFPFLKALKNTIHTATEDRAAIEGRSLPCHVVAVTGQIVTVQFDMLPDGMQYPQVTIPIATFEYIRYPIQVGDKGVTVAADVSLRGISGLGTGIASRSLTLSLVPLFFVPLSNAGWTKEDPNKIILYGPDGAILKTADGASSITVEPGKITEKADAIYLEGKDIYLKGVLHLNGPIVQDAGEMGETTATFIGPMNVTNDVVAGDISLMNHPHDVKNVQSGGSTVQSEKPKAG
ncbi:TPA: phage baseplate protein [Enterobacter asburiae]|uniref:phage baseplate protein n=1 Tax=Enterobacter asburiae TaxID=61645 RepID=UPI001A1D6A7A|nr:phage baseplate protein [Enterobacter asburiae]MCS0625345.1 phage baseplate protein [Enterobacter asburiae]MDE7599680.1 phage baseplate protein [Enterobacter asburiae]HAT7488682.1 phage baseplate protein [Enterobacter asburiae]HAT7510242.1 phage baseplate protein [Enterobacter asburiae]HDR2365266.1 phage baseplate protein [Enterobacter asburiae]